MLKKLIKYEFKATARILLPLYVVILCFALMNKLVITFGYRLDNINNALSSASKIFCMLGYAITMIGLLVVTVVLIVERFYKNLLGDEGYLMNTLPVSVNKNIISKLLVVIAWGIGSIIVVLVSILIMVYNKGIFSKEIANSLNITISNFINWINNEFGTNISIYEVVGIVCLVLFIYIVKSTIMMYSAISIGHLSSKKKLLTSFGAFIILKILEAIIITVFANVLNIDVYAMSNMKMVGTFISFIMLQLIFIGLYYTISNYIIKNKLNLE